MMASTALALSRISSLCADSLGFHLFSLLLIASYARATPGFLPLLITTAPHLLCKGCSWFFASSQLRTVALGSCPICKGFHLLSFSMESDFSSPLMRGLLSVSKLWSLCFGSCKCRRRVARLDQPLARAPYGKGCKACNRLFPLCLTGLQELYAFTDLQMLASYAEGSKSLMKQAWLITFVVFHSFN